MKQINVRVLLYNCKHGLIAYIFKSKNTAIDAPGKIVGFCLSQRS